MSSRISVNRMLTEKPIDFREGGSLKRVSARSGCAGSFPSFLVQSNIIWSPLDRVLKNHILSIAGKVKRLISPVRPDLLHGSQKELS
jgi:hypothetical protein